MRLPSNWNIRKLAEVCEKPEYGYTTSAKTDVAGPLFVRTTDISNGKINWQSIPFCAEPPTDEKRYSLQDGDILIARAGSVGASIIVKNPPRAIFASYLIRFRPKKILDPIYAGFFLKSNSFWIQIGSRTSGTTLPGVNATNLSNVQIPVPPLKIQQKIASILEKAESVKEKRKEANRLTDEFLKSAFLEMFGDPVRNPKGWNVKTIEEVAENRKGSIKCGPFGSQLLLNELQNKGIPVYGIDNVQMNKFIWAKPKFISEKKFQELKSFAIKADAVLISRTGTVGRACLAPPNIPKSIIGPNLLKVSLNKKILLPIVLSVALNYCGSVIQSIKNMSPGATVPVFNTTNLKSLKLAIPLIEEQQKFANLVQKVEKLKEKQSESENELNNLFNSLMQRAFRGELV